MGRKLTNIELDSVIKIENLLLRDVSWKEMMGGEQFWKEVFDRLEKMIKYKTIDGLLPEPEYFTPTDEDAKNRPMVEVRDRDNDNYKWNSRTLIYVGGGNFHCISNFGDSAVPWKYCRMRKQEGNKNV